MIDQAEGAQVACIGIRVEDSDLTWQTGRFPWVALTLATSFGGYGLLRKTASLGALHGLVLETALELAHRVWMGLGFPGPLPGRAIGK